MSLPTFSSIKPENIEQQLTKILDHNRQQISKLLQQKQLDWQTLMQPLEQLDDDLHQFWSPISHLYSVVNSKELREAYTKCLPKLSQYSTEIGHNRALYDAIAKIHKGSQFKNLNTAQQKIIENDLRDFKLAGVDLDEQRKKNHAEICEQLSNLSNQFANNVLDATDAWHYHVTDEKQLAGIPDQAIATAKALAQQKQKTGWLFSLEAPSYLAVMMYADDQSFRKAVYEAFCTRASDQGPNANQWDNSAIMQAILENRLKLAKLLGFESYAHYSLATKMVKQPEQVLKFLQQLVNASLDKAKHEFKELETFAKQQGHNTLNAWDISYYSEKLRLHRYAISEEELRPYFPEDQVLNGLFAIVKKLFAIDVREVKDFDTWHKDVRLFALYDDNNTLISYIYMDLYARENKRGGAWMDDCQSRRLLNNGEVQLPIAYLTCNFSKPTTSKPALFQHSEVVTLFHEFGHSLQHMLTKIDYMAVAGINGVPWDAVELASQFLENWAWQKQGLDLIAKHYQTGDALPDELFAKMHKAKNFQSAMMMVRQLEFALFDFRLHLEFDPNSQNQIQSILDEVRQQVTVIPVPKFNRFQHGFSHIFAGGYAAGYYSYKWAEVMAADAFSLFEEKGIFDRCTSDLFRQTFLESGGAVEPLDLFIKFRGRPPEVAALLHQSGIQA